MEIICRVVVLWDLPTQEKRFRFYCKYYGKLLSILGMEGYMIISLKDKLRLKIEQKPQKVFVPIT